MPTTRRHQTWQLIWWVLFAGWVLGAALNMARVHGGVLTNYLADITFPPWFYIFIRGLHRADGVLPRLVGVGTWFGAQPLRAAVGIFVVGLVSELMTCFWPTGLITGTYDTLDLVAYAVGLALCFAFDQRSNL